MRTSSTSLSLITGIFIAASSAAVIVASLRPHATPIHDRLMHTQAYKHVVTQAQTAYLIHCINSEHLQHLKPTFGL